VAARAPAHRLRTGSPKLGRRTQNPNWFQRMGGPIKRLALALLVASLMAATAHAAESQGRRMIVLALYGAAGTSGSMATSTVIIDVTTQVACREAQDELRRHGKAPGFGLFATCVEP
jgi:hypothetical protein